MRTCFVWMVAVLAGVSAGCAVPQTFGGYLENRRQDLIDAAHVDLSAISAGPVVYAGPFLLGINYTTGPVSGRPAATVQLGLGGPRRLGRKGLAAGLLWPSSRWNEDAGIVGPRPKRAPSGFSAGVAVGVLAGIAAEVDALELVDFAAGLFCLDPTEDDDLGDQTEDAAPDADEAPPN
jgi:hypothetical protein